MAVFLDDHSLFLTRVCKIFHELPGYERTTYQQNSSISMQDTTNIWASKDHRTQGNIQTQGQYVLCKDKKKITIVKRKGRENLVKAMDVMITMPCPFML